MSNRGKGGCCSAIGCSKRRGTNLLSEVKVFRFPRDPVRRAAWANALRRENFVPTDHSVICNDHFITGKPSSDPNHPDYVPSVFSFVEGAVSRGKKRLSRYERHSTRSGVTEKENIPEKRQKVCDDSLCDESLHDDSVCDGSQYNDSQLRTYFSTCKSIEIQTDLTMKDIDDLKMKMRKN